MEKRGRTKENAPPPLSSSPTPEQRNVQKNVNINLFWGPFSCSAISQRRSGAASPASNPSRAASRGKSQVALVRGAKPTRRVLVQTNISCPHQPFWGTSRGVSGGSSQQQSNLENKLRCCHSGNVACGGDPPCFSTIDLGPNCSCLDPHGLKRGPKNDFSGRQQRWSQAPRKELGLCGVSHSCNDTSTGRIGNKDPCALKHPGGGCFVLETTLGTAGDSVFPAESPERSSACSAPHDPCPESLRCCSSSLPPGPALTLAHLSSSTFVEGRPASAAFQVLLCSSQVSADLHGSIQRLKQEAASMGALSSFPRESKSLPRPHQSHLDPRVSDSVRLSASEQLAGKDGCAKQASSKWHTSFAREGGLGSTKGALENAAPHPVGPGCKNALLYAHPAETSDQFWPPAFYGGAGSTSQVCRREQGYSSPSFCYLGCCSRTQQVLEGKETSCHLKTHSHQKTLGPTEPPSRVFQCSELEPRDAPLGTLQARPPVHMGVTMHSTQSKARLTHCSPEVDQLGKDSEYAGLSQLQGEQKGAAEELPARRAKDEEALPLLAESSMEEAAGECLQEHLSAAMDSAGPTVLGGSSSGSQNFNRGDCQPDAAQVHSEEPPAEKNAERSKSPHCEESRPRMDAVSKETLGRSNGSMDGRRNRGPPRRNWLLAKCFTAWHNRVVGRRAAAQVLYEQQLLRKGLGALKWAVELRDVQVGIAQRRHNLTVLAASFCRWQSATAKKQKEQASRMETETRGKDLLTVLQGETIAKGPILRQLSPECLEAATHYSRAEGNLWLQMPCNQGADKLCRKIQAVRDMRRLAAAFRLWCLQKERLEQAESHAQEVCALLVKRRLRSVFGAWQSRCRATQRILPLLAQVQQRMVSRCFSAWKGFAGREACARRCLDRRRVGALRLCLQQWARMVQIRERARMALLQLLALRWRTARARSSLAPNAPKTQPHLNTVRPPQRSGPDTLDGLFIVLVLQKMFYVWKIRWRRQQQADAFCRAVEQKLLRGALGRWRWKALSLAPTSLCTGDFTEDALLASLESDELSQSSGFHSNTPVLCAPSDSFNGEAFRSTELILMSSCGQEQESSLVDSSHSRQLSHHISPSATPSPAWEDLQAEAVESCIQASSPLRSWHIRREDFARDPFQSSGFLSHDCNIHSITVSSSWELGGSGESEAATGKMLCTLVISDSAELERQSASQVHSPLLKLQAAHTKHPGGNKMPSTRSPGALLRSGRAFISWTVATAHHSMQRKAQDWLESTRQRHLLASCFRRWKDEALRAEQQREERSLQRRPAECLATRRWRKAVRGSRALRLHTGTAVQEHGGVRWLEGFGHSLFQSCNYWTKAAALSLCLRQRSSLVGASKFLKSPLSWPSKQRSREEGLPPNGVACARLNGSAFHVWLMIYRCQNRTAGPSQQGPLESPGRAEGKGKPFQIQNSSSGTDSVSWLWKKYLRLWRLNVLLRRFQDAGRMRLLVSAWLLWKDTCRTEWVVQALARQKLAQWGWKAWRRRYLQARVAERFLEAQDRSLLTRAFGRWRHLAAQAHGQLQGSP